MLTQGHDEFLWRQAAELLQNASLLEGQPQEVSRNYDAAARSCPVFADFGVGAMQPLVSLYQRPGSRRAFACWRRAPAK